MQRTALVQTYHPYTQFTHVHPLGVMMIASVAEERGHTDLHVLDMKVEDWTPEQCVENLVELEPAVVGLSAMTYEAGCMHDVAKLVKERLPNVVVICGGPHPSVADTDVMEDGNVDFVVRGEGEFIFADLLDELEKDTTDFTELTGINWRNAEGEVIRNPDRSPPQDLDELPFPPGT